MTALVDDGLTDNSPALRELIARRAACQKTDAVEEHNVSLVHDHVVTQSVSAAAPGLADRQYNRLTFWASIRWLWRRLHGAGR